MDMAERVAVLGADVKNLKDSVVEDRKNNKDEHNELKVIIASMSDKMDKWMDAAPSKFASKRTEVMMWLVIGAIITGLIAKVMDKI